MLPMALFPARARRLAVAALTLAALASPWAGAQDSDEAPPGPNPCSSRWHNFEARDHTLGEIPVHFS